MSTYHTEKDVKKLNNQTVNFLLTEYAANGNLEDIKNLINENNIKNLNLNECLSYACKSGHLNVVKFFLETEKFKSKINLHATIDFIPNGLLLHSHFNDKDNIVEYLLYDIKFNIDENTKKFLIFHKYESLLIKIEKRDLFFQMCEEINNTDQKEKTPKPKL